MELGVATARLEILKRVLSPEYGEAIEEVIARAAPSARHVARDCVIAMLTDRASKTDYLVLRSVLLECAEVVRQL